MSSTLHDTGLFTSRKRRTGEVADGFKDGAKRPLTVEKIRCLVKSVFCTSIFCIWRSTCCSYES